jgi:hypothetical protein
VQVPPKTDGLFDPIPYSVAKKMVRGGHQQLAPIMNLLAAGETLSELENMQVRALLLCNNHFAIILKMEEACRYAYHGHI